LFREVRELSIFGLGPDLPVRKTLDWRAALSAAAMLSMLRFRAGMIPTLFGGGATGMLMYLATTPVELIEGSGKLRHPNPHSPASIRAQCSIALFRCGLSSNWLVCKSRAVRCRRASGTLGNEQTIQLGDEERGPGTGRRRCLRRSPDLGGASR